MKDGVRTVCYDRQLQVEAYQFQGVMQPFPNHFHDYYVVGFIEKGLRHMTCKNRTYQVHPGDLILLSPGENHACKPLDESPLDYRCLNIKPEMMEGLHGELFGSGGKVFFQSPVVSGSRLVPSLQELHRRVMERQTDLSVEEGFYLFMEQLIHEQGVPADQGGQHTQDFVALLCDWMEGHYSEGVSLDQLSALAGQNKYTLIRAFTREKGITPYRYLTTLRIGRAKTLLECGVSPLDCGLETGFSDQSHFSTTFKELIGLTPKQYQNIFMEAEHGSS